MKSKLFNCLVSILIPVSIFVNMIMFENIKEIDYTILYSLNVFAMSIVAVFTYRVLNSIKSCKITKLKRTLSIIFAIFMVLGECYTTGGTYKLMFLNWITKVLALCKVFSFTILFGYLFYFLDKFLSKLTNDDIKPKTNLLKKYISLFDKHPFITSFITILLVWSIYLIAYYPIVLSPDPSNQIKQFLGVHTKYMDWVILRDPNVTITAHHPILQTYLLGWALNFGRSLGSDNFGLFIYTISQTIIYVAVLSYSISFAKKNNVKNRFALILLGIYLFVPMFAFYSVSAVKDTLYTSFMMLFVLFIFDVIKNYQNDKVKIIKLIYFYLVMLSLGLFRHNGVYVILMTIPFVMLVCKKNALRLLIPVVLFFASITTFDKVIVPSMKIADGSVREMLSIPFQQTARLAKEKPKAITAKDKKVIDKVLQYKDLAKRYKPELSDPVKNKYNPKTTDKELKEYFKVWVKYLPKNLDIYVDATMNNIYGFFYPNTHKWYVYSAFDTRITEDNLVDYHYNKCDGLRKILEGYANIFVFIPVIGLMSNIGVCTWLVLIIFVYLINKKMNKYLVTLAPLLGSILFCVLGPANTYFRYAMPYIFVLPVLIMLLLCISRGDKDVIKKER